MDMNWIKPHFWEAWKAAIVTWWHRETVTAETAVSNLTTRIEAEAAAIRQDVAAKVDGVQQTYTDLERRVTAVEAALKTPPAAAMGG
jgi:3-methyladenine DNA glycosylase/8-oxoguanine DNA glycosylase